MYFYISILLTTLFIIWGITPASWIQGYDLQSVTSSLNSFILNKFGWFYSLLMTAMIILAAYLAFSKYGSIRLGKDGENQSIVIHLGYPCYLGQEWELDSSFMESLNRFHTFTDPLTGKAGTEESAKLAMQYSFFHWGLFPWSLYAMVALTIAYFTFRKQKVAQLGLQLLHYLIDRKILLSENSRYFSCFSHSIWYCAICWDWCSTNCWGLSYLFPSIHNTLLTQLVLIAIFAVLYLTSAQTGLDRGIKYLSNLNFLLQVYYSSPSYF